jgi:hypothetical protein
MPSMVLNLHTMAEDLGISVLGLDDTQVAEALREWMKKHPERDPLNEYLKKHLDDPEDPAEGESAIVAWRRQAETLFEYLDQHPDFTEEQREAAIEEWTRTHKPLVEQ